MHNFLDQFESLRKRRRPVALASVVGIEGGSSKRLGARLWVTEEGDTYGSLTVGGCVDGRARDEARDILGDGASRRVRIELGEDGLDFGMSCAGTVDVFIERVDLSNLQAPVAKALDRVRKEIDGGRVVVYATPLDDATDPFVITSDDGLLERPVRSLFEEADTRCVFFSEDGDGDEGHPGIEGDGRTGVLYQSFVPPHVLVVVGAAPIAHPLVRLGKMLGFRVLMVDGKAERLTRERFPEADELLVGIPSEICGRLSLDARSAVVLTAHDYRYEVPVLKDVLRHPTAYVGFVGSRRRGGAVLAFLASTGIIGDLISQSSVSRAD